MPVMGTTDYTVRLLNNGVQIAEIAPMERMRFVQRYNMPDILEITVAPDAGLLIGMSQRIEVWRNGRRLSSMQPVRIYRKYSKDRNRFEISARGALELLRHRVIYPAPDGNFSQTPDPKEYYTVTGAVDDVIKDLIRQNLTASPMSARNTSEFSVAPNRSLGPTVTFSGRFDNLYQAVAALATANNMRVVIRDGVLEVENIADRSADIKFSVELGNVQEFYYDARPPDVTTVIMRGDGQDPSTGADLDLFAIVSGNDEASFGRRESFRTGRGTNITVADLEAQAAEYLATKGRQFNLNITPTFESGDYITFREPFVDFEAGDIIGVNIDGVDFKLQVQEISFLWNDKEARERVTFGEWGDGLYRLFPLRDPVNDISERLRTLEAKA